MREAQGPAWTDWLREHGVVALDGIDTRSLVLHLRDRGAMRAAIAATRRRDRSRGRGQPAMEGAALVARRLDAGAVRLRRARPRARRGRRLRDEALDPAAARRRGRRGDGLPARRRRRRARRATTASSSRTARATRSRSSTRRAVVRDLLGRMPVLGICLGHQLLGARDRPRDLQAAVRPPRREPPGARARDRPRARHSPEPRLRGRADRGLARRRTSRSTTARSRASTSRT